MVERPKVDKNRQKYSQIKSYFESGGGKERSGSQSKLKSKKDCSKELKDCEKYTDAIFPPVYSSLFLLQKHKKIAEQISWKRLSDCNYEIEPVVLPKNEESEIIIELD